MVFQQTPQISRLQTLAPEVAQRMQTSFNGAPFETVRDELERGELALLRADFGDSDAFCFVSRQGDMICIEAVEGQGGAMLVRRITECAKAHGLGCEGWTFIGDARLRLWARVGYHATGKRRISASGREQLQVVA